MATVMDGIPQAPQAAQRPRGLLGGFFGPEGRDARSRLAIGLEGLAMNPNQALIGQLQQGIETRATASQKNATIEWLRARGHDDLSAALEAGASPQDVLAESVRRMQPANPLDAINLQKAQLELQQMQNPQPGFRRATPEESAAYGAQAGQFGPDGRFYAEEVAQPEGAYRQVTGAELGLTGAEAQKMFNVSPNGQVTAIGGAGTTVTNVIGGQDKFEEAFAKSDAERLAMIEDTGISAMRNVSRIDLLDQMLQNAPQGMEGQLKSLAGEFGINSEGLDDIQSAQALINSLVPEQRAPGSGPMSDADLNLFKQSLPRIVNQPGGNRAIVQAMRAIAEYDAMGASIAQRFRDGQIDRTETFRLLKSRPDPLANLRNQMGDAGGGAGQPTMTPEQAARILLESANGG